MHIGIDALFRFQGGGEVHLRKLSQNWRQNMRGQRITVYTLEQNLPVLKQFESDCLHIRGFRTPDRHFLLKLIWEQTVLLRELQRDQIDIVLGIGGMIPILSGRPKVVILRNAGPFCESVNPRTMGWRGYARFVILGLTMRLAVQHATHVIFISQYFKDIFTQRFGFSADKGSVIYHGYEATRPGTRSIYQPDGDYFVYVSYLIPYKNVREVIQGFMLMCQQHPEHTWKLLLVGGPRHVAYANSIYELVKSHDLLKDRVVFTGTVSHEEVSALLARASAFVFASTCENCPNSLIEALAYGLPIANSRIGVMPEITGDAALYFDPYRPTEIADALLRISTDSALRQTLAERSRRRIQDFRTWSGVAELTLDTLESVFETAQQNQTSRR